MSVKFQALILIFIIFISLSLSSKTNVFSRNQFFSEKNQTAAFVVLREKADDSDILSKNQETNSNLPPQPSQKEIPQSQEKTLLLRNANSSESQNLSYSKISENRKISETTLVEESSLAKEKDSKQNCSSLETEFFLVKNIENNKTIFENRSNYRWPIASITKLMTALVALENMNLSSVLEISPQAFQKAYNSHILLEKEKYSVESLIKAALVFSSNEAAYSLAEGFGYNDFILKMNQKAKELGMKNTSFDEPTGLSYLNQSTLEDIYLLINYIYHNNPLILDISRKKSVSLREEGSGKIKTFSNINLFAGQPNFFGGKTGFIDASGENLVTLFKKNQGTFFIGVLASRNRFSDVEKLLKCLEQQNN
ncbi:MAG: hypothetical protein KatS3mg098_402 [Candidatus Parcubacteria bacterium]|nr:serine hydrolase [Patescibacteria group bacterium]BCX16173.1 MAG: hypothetical protein KatS3mg098_402 [Candidatus Parcubacteria bacterium]